MRIPALLVLLLACGESTQQDYNPNYDVDSAECPCCDFVVEQVQTEHTHELLTSEFTTYADDGGALTECEPLCRAFHWNAQLIVDVVSCEHEGQNFNGMEVVACSYTENTYCG
jgi:hypothetical protein